MDPFGAGAVLHWPTPSGHISSAHSTWKDGAIIGMNVAAHQENEKNEETKTEKKKTEEKIRAVSTKQRAALSAVVQMAARQKNSLCEGGVWVKWDPREGQGHFDQTQTRSGAVPPR